MATKKTKNQTVTIKTNEENPEPIELIAQAIISISDACKKLQSGKVKQRVIVLLIKDSLPHLKLSEIEEVLNTVPKLKERYLNKV